MNGRGDGRDLSVVLHCVYLLEMIEQLLGRGERHARAAQRRVLHCGPLPRRARVRLQPSMLCAPEDKVPLVLAAQALAQLGRRQADGRVAPKGPDVRILGHGSARVCRPALAAEVGCSWDCGLLRGRARRRWWRSMRVGVRIADDGMGRGADNYWAGWGGRRGSCRGSGSSIACASSSLSLSLGWA